MNGPSDLGSLSKSRIPYGICEADCGGNINEDVCQVWFIVAESRRTLLYRRVTWKFTHLTSHISSHHTQHTKHFVVLIFETNLRTTMQQSPYCFHIITLPAVRVGFKQLASPLQYPSGSSYSLSLSLTF